MSRTLSFQEQIQQVQVTSHALFLCQQLQAVECPLVYELHVRVYSCLNQPIRLRRCVTKWVLVQGDQHDEFVTINCPLTAVVTMTASTPARYLNVPPNHL